MKVIHLLWLLVLPLFVHSQTTFSRIYPDGTDSDILKDMVYVSANEYAFITRSNFYRIDNKGNILTNNSLKQGISTFLYSMLTDQTGHFYIAGYMATSLSDSKMLLYKLNSGGQLLFLYR
ncbi:hypothetical protein [Paraflavitalea speifideaquila]|uniref:hypothetical protein n=1 Tax=Paraflavitalea speifideaquila TaxID=3076558 RepID=UPI0028E92BD0|nr:hypothetical protein [Paraflavitalea speifideiaquila]